jgi:hypothetical protein
MGDIFPGEPPLGNTIGLGAKTGRRPKDSVSVEILLMLMLIAEISDAGRWRPPRPGIWDAEL